ncbi:MAG: (2Fe-2S) ferredoxin domain-containing protein [Candidatus Eisenbacteria bacterium]|nr:(2Fe-2S) ferredoxin domain-containing protein [Candidatus Eisenbacteria bacterium]
MAKLKIEDLKRIKESTKGTVNLRDGEYRVKVTVHMGTCGIAAGARKVLGAFRAALEESGANDVILTTSGCAGLCNHEPMATIEVRDAAPVKYIKLDEEKVQRIFQEHVIEGRPVAEYALSMGSETTH